MSLFRRLLMDRINSNNKIIRKILTFDELQNENTIHKIFPNLVDYSYQINIWLIGNGGKGGAAGDNWGLYKGGSGGAGTNGNIIAVSSKIQSTDKFLVKSENKTHSLIYKNVMISTVNDGGDGGDGGDTGAFIFQGSAGIGGTSEPPINYNVNGWNEIYNYYDEKAPNGRRSGNGGGIISPNKMPDIIYNQYGIGGYGNDSESKVDGVNGCVGIEVTYLEEQWGKTMQEAWIDTNIAIWVDAIKKNHVQFKPGIITDEYSIPDATDTDNLVSLKNTFFNCITLKSFNFSRWNTMNVTILDNVFDGCVNLESLTLSNIDFNKIQSYNNIFVGCNNLNKITCTIEVKNWLIENQDIVQLPNSLREGGNGEWILIN